MTLIAHSEREIPREAFAAAGVAASARGRARLARAAGQRLRRPPLPERRCSRITASRSGTTSGTRAATASSPTAFSTTRSRRCSGSSCSPSRASRPRRSRSGSSRRANGDRLRAGRTAPSPSSGRASSSPAPSRSPSAWRSRCSRCGRCRPGGAAALRSSPCSCSPRAPSRSSSSPWSSPASGSARAPRRTASSRSRSRRSRVATAVELVLLRLFPAGGRFPFSLPEFAAACVFCGLGILLTWRVAHGRGAPVDLRRLPRRLHGRVPRPVEPRREHRTAPLRRHPDRDPDALAAPLAAAAGCRPRALARGRLEPDPARRQLREDERGSGGRPGVLGSGGAVPPHAPRPRRTASRRSTPSATGPPPTCRRRESRSRADGSGRTTSRATASSTATSTAAGYLAWLRSLGVRYVVLPDAPLDYSAKAGGRSARGRPVGPAASRSGRHTRPSTPFPPRAAS